MTLRIHQTKAFKRDMRKMTRQGKDMAELYRVIEMLANGEVLEAKYLDHALTGNWKYHRDCHIRPDWLLIYRVTDGVLYLERTGSHTELFR